MTDQELVELAFTMLERSYVPYSHFPVGAALECADGTVFTGCNVENAAYGSSICAERTALVKAVSEGHRDDFTRIAVVGNSTEPCWPCGACRQMLYEFAPGLTVLVAQRDHSFVKLPLSELLTHGRLSAGAVPPGEQRVRPGRALLWQLFRELDPGDRHREGRLRCSGL